MPLPDEDPRRVRAGDLFPLYRHTPHSQGSAPHWMLASSAGSSHRLPPVFHITQRISPDNAAAVNAQDTEIATLRARVAELEKKPAESTSAIVSDGHASGDKPDSPMDAFTASVRRAREIYDQLP